MARNNNISQITVGRRALLSEELKNNWESLDINQLDIPQDTPVCMFGGNVTLRPNQANGNSKVIESLLPKNLRDRINLYSFGYASEPIKSEGYLSKEYEKETKLLYKKTFEPVLYDSAGNMKEKQG